MSRRADNTALAAALDRMEQKLDRVLAELQARKTRRINRAQRVARNAEAGVRIIPDELTQRKAAGILKKHARRGVR